MTESHIKQAFINDLKIYQISNDLQVLIYVFFLLTNL